MADFSTNQFVGLLAVGISLKLYLDHQNGLGKFNNNGNYPNVSPFKHDILKTLVADLLPILLLSKNVDSLFDFQGNLLESLIGKTLIIISYYLVYYHWIEPYFANELKNF